MMTTLKSVGILGSCKGCVAVGNAFIVSNVESKMQSCEHHQEIPCRPWVNIQPYGDFRCCAISENKT